jgi:hypothetical protein
MQLDQARQEAGERLAAAGRRDEQGRMPLPRRLGQRQLVRPRRPAAPANQPAKSSGNVPIGAANIASAEGPASGRRRQVLPLAAVGTVG